MVEAQDIIEVLKEMQEDMTVPKNVKNKLLEVEGMLNSEEERKMNVNKAIDMIIDLADDVNLQPHVRTRILNLMSMLESL